MARFLSADFLRRQKHYIYTYIYIYIYIILILRFDKWRKIVVCGEIEILNSKPSAVAAHSLPVDIPHRTNTCKHKCLFKIQYKFIYWLSDFYCFHLARKFH